jgi:hypothetical protein
LHSVQRCLAALEGLQGSLAVRDLCRGHRHRMRQPLGVHRDVALDARDLLAGVIALQGPLCPCSLHSVRPRSRACWRRCAPVSRGPRQPDFFNACSSRLTPSWPGSLHWAKYECTVRHLGKSLGSARHWQPVRSRYSTAQNTSYRSTVLGLVLRLACASSGKIGPNCSLRMSLGYLFVRIPRCSQTQQKIVNTF